MCKERNAFPPLLISFSLKAVGGRKTKNDTLCERNEAYNIFGKDQMQMVGQQGIQEYEEIGPTSHSIAHQQQPISAKGVRGGEEGGGGGGGRGGGRRRGGGGGRRGGGRGGGGGGGRRVEEEPYYI